MQRPEQRPMTKSMSRLSRIVGGCLLIAIGALVALGLLGWALLESFSFCSPNAYPPCGMQERPLKPLFSPSTQSTVGADISIQSADWDSRSERSGWRFVALRVRYRANADGLRYSREDWVAHDTAGVTYDAMAGPTAALGSGQRRAGQIASGWVGFVVPKETRTLDVTFRQGDAEPLSWRIDDGGARKAPVPPPHATPIREG